MLIKKKIKSSIVKKYETQIIRRVVSPETAQRTRMLMRYAVENGTGNNADVEGLKVGGKTGTSQKVIDGKYSKNKYDASFIGVVPYDNPALVCLVVIDSPKESIYGGTVAAPVFKNIIRRIYNENMSNSLAERKKGSKVHEVPDLKGLKYSVAENTLKEAGIKYKTIKKGEIIEYQSKKPFTLISEDHYLIISGEKNNIHSDDILELTPSSIDLTSREAVKLMHSLGINPIIVGKGNVYAQSNIHIEELTGAKTCSLFAKLPSENLVTGKSTARAGR